MKFKSAVAPGALHIKAYKAINFALHPIVFACLHSNAY